MIGIVSGAGKNKLDCVSAPGGEEMVPEPEGILRHRGFGAASCPTESSPGKGWQRNSPCNAIDTAFYSAQEILRRHKGTCVNIITNKSRFVNIFIIKIIQMERGKV